MNCPIVRRSSSPNRSPLECFPGGRILVTVPTPDLLAQNAQAWRLVGHRTPMIAVCSPTVSTQVHSSGGRHRVGWRPPLLCGIRLLLWPPPRKPAVPAAGTAVTSSPRPRLPLSVCRAHRLTSHHRTCRGVEALRPVWSGATPSCVARVRNQATLPSRYPWSGHLVSPAVFQLAGPLPLRQYRIAPVGPDRRQMSRWTVVLPLKEIV